MQKQLRCLSDQSMVIDLQSIIIGKLCTLGVKDVLGGLLIHGCVDWFGAMSNRYCLYEKAI